MARLAVLVLPTLRASIDAFVVLIALPRISAEPGAGTADQLMPTPALLPGLCDRP